MLFFRWSKWSRKPFTLPARLPGGYLFWTPWLKIIWKEVIYLRTPKPDPFTFRWYRFMSWRLLKIQKRDVLPQCLDGIAACTVPEDTLNTPTFRPGEVLFRREYFYRCNISFSGTCGHGMGYLIISQSWPDRHQMREYIVWATSCHSSYYHGQRPGGSSLGCAGSSAGRRLWSLTVPSCMPSRSW